VHLTDNSLLPSHQEPLIITAVTDLRVGSVTEPTITGKDFWKDHIQLAADCLEAGASILHLTVQDPVTGRVTSQVAHWANFMARLRREVPGLLIQLDGAARLEPRGAAQRAEWRGLDSRHMLTEIEPKPDFVTIEVYSSSTGSASAIDDNEKFISNQLIRLRRNDIQPYFLLRGIQALGLLERLVRSGRYMGPLNHCMIAAGGEHIGNNPLDWMEYLRRAPDGSTVAFQGSTPITPPLAAVTVAFGIHIRVSSPISATGASGQTPLVEQVKHVVRIARELGRTVATRDDTRRIMKTGIWFDSVEETLFILGLLPNQRGRSPNT